MAAASIRLMLILLAFAAAGSAPAADFPVRPIRILHGFSVGGTPDIVLRRIASGLENRLGQTVVVENRPGATGTIAAASVARAAPDGYTLLFGVAANLAVAPALMADPPYDPAVAFSPIVEVARGPYVWLVGADAPVRSLPEFIDWARRAPGKLNYASPGRGSVHHLATELFKQAAGVDMVHVAYKSGLYSALMAGEVQAMFESLPGPLPHLEAGKVRALAVTGQRRLPILPGVPTFQEQGVADPDVSSWWGLVGPAGLPEAIVARLNSEVTTVLADPGLLQTLRGWGIEATPGSAAGFGNHIRGESLRWKERVTRFGIALE